MTTDLFKSECEKTIDVLDYSIRVLCDMYSMELAEPAMMAALQKRLDSLRGAA